MHKRLLMYALLSLALAASASALDTAKKEGRDFWPITEEGWAQCLDLSVRGTYYYPDETTDKTGKSCPVDWRKGEYIAGHPGGCQVLDMPDRLTRDEDEGRALGRFEPGRRFVVNANGDPIRLPECCNDGGEWRPFPLPKDGVDGIDGVDGRTPTVTVGTVTEGDVASVKNSGTETDVVLDFVIPKGKDGNDGLPGINCEYYKTRGFFRKFTWKQCPGEERVRIRASLRPWVVGGLVVVGAATGGALAPVYCYTIVSGAAVGGVAGAATAGAANVVADTDSTTDKQTTEQGTTPKEKKP